jgi:hypothetical protein
MKVNLAVFLKMGNVYSVFEVPTAVVMKCAVFCDITPSSPFKINLA